MAETLTTRKTYCRFCGAACAIDVDIDGGTPVALRGDPDNILSGGYTCIRGRELITMHTHPDRIRTALKRSEDGFEPISLQQALTEIIDKTRDLIERNDARAIASYVGSWAYSNAPTVDVAKAFHRAIGSPWVFSPMTLDQPAKALAPYRFGIWSGGLHSFRDAEVVMFIGNNPLLSQYAPKGGLPIYNPARRFQDAVNNGLKVIIIDPRRSEIARRSQLHLQPRPGEDSTLLAGMLRLIFDNDWHDSAFCERYVAGLTSIKRAVEPFTPDYVAKRCDIPETQLLEATRLFAQAKRGAATTGTGPEMAPNGWLTEHLVMTLNTVCGRYYREGEISAQASVLGYSPQPKAQVILPGAAWGEGFYPSRFRGLTQVGDEMPCNVMADEILTPGEGRIRALFCIGGNPLVAFPDQEKVGRALKHLELLVAIDPWHSATAKQAHYILPPKLAFEREDATLFQEMYFEEPYAHYTEAIIESDAEWLEEWELYWELAHHLDVELNIARKPLPMDKRPTKYALLTHMARKGRVPLEQIRAETAAAGGKIYTDARAVVAPGDPDNNTRFQIAPADIVEALATTRAEPLTGDGRPQAIADYPFLLTCRRTRQFFNSTGHNFPNLQAKGRTNHAWMHPDDLADLGIEDDALIEIEAEHGTIVGVARGEPHLRRGMVSMSHAFGDIDSDTHNIRQQGVTTSRLVADDKHYDPVTGQARQSAIPVVVRPLRRQATASQ